MPTPRFLQIHTLHSYPAALLNRDDSGLAKRMPFGGAVRTRISSQCLKRHWRDPEDKMKHEYAFRRIPNVTMAVRSRNVVSLRVIEPLKEAKVASENVLQAVETVFQARVYSGSGTQPLLLGLPEVDFLKDRATTICKEHPDDSTAARNAAEDLFHTRRGEGNNFRAFREQTKLPGGLESALFGRMVTSDISANIEASIHVAHAFTVHSMENDMDYFAAVEELPKEEEGSGAAFLGDMELTAGLFYGYVVVDVPGLVSNLEGCKSEEWESADRELAAKVVEHLTHLIATVSPGAKLGSTAPYACADLVLMEAGNRQPRSLANAYRDPARAQVDDATHALAGYLDKLDACYGAKEARRVASVEDCDIPNAERLPLDDLASWAAATVRRAGAN